MSESVTYGTTGVSGGHRNSREIFLLISKGCGSDSGRTGCDSELPSALRAENTSLSLSAIYLHAERSPDTV